MSTKSRFNQQSLKRLMNARTVDRNDYSLIAGNGQLQKNHLFVGHHETTTHWVLYVSATWPRVSTILKKIVPSLKALNVPFRIPKNLTVARQILDGYLGSEEVGKVMSVYPKTNQEALDVAKKLISLTQNEEGPSVPDSHYLGGTVYTTRTDGVSVPWPFDEIKKEEEISSFNFVKNYRIVYPLKLDIKGRVLYAIKWHLIPPFVKKYVLKEARQGMFANSRTEDVLGRLRWQYELHLNLQNHLTIPKVFELFEHQRNLYLVMEYINGALLHNVIEKLHDGPSWPNLSSKRKKSLIGLLISIIDLIQALHELGYVHRDISPSNFLLTKRGKLYLIDLELCYRLSDTKAAFRGGTEGYRPPEELVVGVPSIKGDVYSLGALSARVLLNIAPGKSGLTTSKKPKNDLREMGLSQNLADIIGNCLSKKPDTRPELVELRNAIRDELEIR